MAERDIARRLLACLDLTDLSDGATEGGLDALCRRAVDAPGPVAAVCVWPCWVARAARALAGSPVRVATVANFPTGRGPPREVAAEVEAALRDGADEIDLVLPYERYLAGERDGAFALVRSVRAQMGGGHVLKLILETGALADPSLIREAGERGIEAGADFLKTSTGKSPVSATPDAARALLEAIRAAGRPVGLKVSGGLRTLADAALYLDLAEQAMGPGWASPATFRIGASALHDALVAAIEGGP